MKKETLALYGIAFFGSLYFIIFGWCFIGWLMAS